jgi:hypothetical protein
VPMSPTSCPLVTSTSTILDASKWGTKEAGRLASTQTMGS